VDEAIAAYRKAIELDPRFALAHSNLGNALLDQKKPDEAIAAYRKAIELDPNLTLAHNNLGNALRDQKKLPEAVAAFRKAIELDPKYAFAHTNLGLALYDQKKWDEAIAAFRKAIELDPNLANAYNGLAWLLATWPEAKARDPGRAVVLAKKAVELAPNYWGYLNTLGAAYYRAGDWKAAIAALNRSVGKVGENAFDGFFLAMSHWQLGEKDKAREWYDRAVQWVDKNAPTDEELRRFRAEASELLGVKEEK
jgi:superkiller protein 3